MIQSSASSGARGSESPAGPVGGFSAVGAARVLVLSLAASILLSSCSESPAAVSGARHEPPRVRRGDFRQVVHLTGEIEASEGLAIVVPRIPNWQTSVKTLIENGTRVEAGQVLTELDSTAFSTGLQQKRLSKADAEQSLVQQIARAAAELEQKELDVERTRIELDKAKSKAEIPSDVLPRRTYEENQLALRRAAVAYEKAMTDLESQRKAARAESANLRIEIDKTQREITVADEAITSMTLRAPAAGVVVIQENEETGRKLQIGDSVWVGWILMMITNLDTLQIKAILVDVDDGKVQPGQRVDLTLDAYPETRLRGKVTQVTSVADTLARDSLRRGFTVTITLEKAKPGLLRPGFSVRATVVRREMHDVLLAPRAALDLSVAAPKVRLRDGTWVPLELGACNAHDCVVLDGLEEGQALRVTAPGEESS